MTAPRPRPPFRRRLTPGFVWTAVVAFLGAVLPNALAEPLDAVSDGEHFWRAVYDEVAHETVIYHHPRDEAEAGRLRRITAITGRLVPGGLAAEGGSLWLFFADGTVEAVQARRAEHHVGWRYGVTVRPPLPAGTRAMAVTALRGRAWVLARADPGADLAALTPVPTERSAESRSRSRRIALGLPPSPRDEETSREPEVSPATSGVPVDPQPDGAPQAEAQPPSAPRQVLLVERGSHWRAVALPTDWPGLKAPRVWLTPVKPDDTRPTLLTAASVTAPLTVFRPEGGGWVATGLASPGYDPALQAIGVGGQLLLGVPIGEDRLRVTMHVVRDGSSLPFPTELEASATDPWRLGPWAGDVGLFSAPRGPTGPPDTDDSQAAPGVVQHPPGATAVTTRSWTLRGEALADPQAWAPAVVSPWEGRADTVLLIATVLTAMSLSVFVWKQTARPEALPATVGVPAELWRRLAAALIDLAPAAAATMLLLGLSPMELAERWPPQPEGMTWFRMMPAGVTAVLFVAYTSAFEAMTGRTPGKRLLRLRVVRFDGSAPRGWQVVVRCVTKTIELVLWIALVVALLTPARQRLGDLAAKTVVVLEPREGDPGPKKAG